MKLTSSFGPFEPAKASNLFFQPETTIPFPDASADKAVRTTLSGVSPIESLTTGPVRPARLKKSVEVGPGHTERTSTPVPRSSSLKARLQCKIKALDAP